MADANLLSVLNKNLRSGLRELMLFGRVRCALQKTSFLADLDTKSNGFFALLDTYAVKCLGEDYFASYGSGFGDSDSLYFVRGSILIFLDDKSLVGENVKVLGASKNRGVTVRRQFAARARNEGISAFVFQKEPSGFVISPNKAVPLMSGDTSVKGTSLEDFVASVVINKEAKINYPATLDSYEVFNGIDNFSVLDLDTVELQGTNFLYKEDSEGMIDVTKAPMELTHHFAEELTESALLEPVKEEIDSLSKKRYFFSRDLRGDYLSIVLNEGSDDFNPSQYGSRGEFYTTPEIASDIRDRFVNNIANRYNEKISNTKIKFKVFIDSLMDSLYKTKWVDDKDKDFSYKAIFECIDKLKKSIPVNPQLLYGTAMGDIGSIPILKDPIKMASLIIAVTLGISEGSVVGNANSCYNVHGLKLDVWFCMLIRNPYALGMLGSGLSLGDCDKIYYSFGHIYNNGMCEYKAVESRNDLLFLENMKSLCNKDSFVSQSTMASQMGEYPWAYRRYVLKNGFPASRDCIECVSTLLGYNIASIFNTKLLRQNPYTKKRVSALCDTKGVLAELELSGQTYYALSSDIEKEYIIYTKLFSKGQALTELDDSIIEECSKNFEEKRGFSLEPLQRDGIQLCKYQAAVLSGCAGSGKTTVSDCMTMIFKEAFPKKKILYSTPTGKACRRLAEVTGGDVKTLHSRFGIMVGDAPYLCDVRVKEPQSEGVIYIMDEMAMCSMDLLFETVKNISHKDFVYFLGDIKQLPTIGRGNPFKLLMSFLPCIELGVSKRAAEGSKVNYNTTLINNFSDNIIQELKYDDSTFIACECSDAEISMKTCSMFLNFMNGTQNGTRYAEDDIQVITGYQKEDCLFSAPVLNKPLHEALRKNDKVLFEYGDKVFCVNERVMHMKRNAYEMPRYRKDGSTFKEVVTFGCVNGEMGKIVGMIRSDQATIIPFSNSEYKAEHEDDESMLKLLDQREEKADIIQDNSVFSSDKLYFVLVQVYDVNLKENVIVLYHAHTREIGFGEVVFEGGDLPYLDYAYALTTHKMQGSQSPVVICVFGSTCTPSFINRNMINTMFTRSQGIVGVVGTVKGADSPINQGRRYVSALYCKDMLSVLTGVIE